MHHGVVDTNVQFSLNSRKKFYTLLKGTYEKGCKWSRTVLDIFFSLKSKRISDFFSKNPEFDHDIFRDINIAVLIKSFENVL